MKTKIKDIRKIVEAWKPRLGLVHWTVEVRRGEPDFEDAVMEITRHENAYRAVITVAPWLLDGKLEGNTLEEVDERYVEIAVVHELCHLLFRDMRFIVVDYLELNGSPQDRDLVDKSMYRAEEQAVDTMSVALVDAWSSRS